MTDNSNEIEAKHKANAHTSIKRENEHIQESCPESQGNPNSYLSSEPGIQPEIIIVRYGELALKSTGVRNWYEKVLIKNIEAMLDSKNIPYSQIRREWGRIFIETKDVRAAEAVADVFGVVSTSPALKAEPTLENAASLCAALAKNLVLEGESFAIRARRSGNHPFSSIDV